MDIKKIASFFRANDRFAAFNGIRLVEVTPGRAVTVMDISENHLNSVGVVHGGALFTLADFAFAAACNSQGTISLAVSTSMNFVKAVSSGRVRAVCEQVTDGKLANYQAKIYDEDGEIIAVFSGLAYRKKEMLPIE
jgi:acyl-CoA thioesterase